MVAGSAYRVIAVAVLSWLVASCGTPISRRQSFNDTCVRRYGGASCAKRIAAVSEDCRAGDAASCKLACEHESPHGGKAAACQSSCQQGVAASCGIQAASLWFLVTRDKIWGKNPDVRPVREAAAAGCAGGDGDSCVLEARVTPGLTPSQKSAAFRRGCDLGGRFACLLVGVNELEADRTESAIGDFRRAAGVPGDRGIGSAGFLECLTGGVLPGTEQEMAIRRQAFCVRAASRINDDFQWARTSAGNLLARLPAAAVTSPFAFDWTVLPPGRDAYCFVAGPAVGYDGALKQEACSLSEADCRREIAPYALNKTWAVRGNAGRPACERDSYTSIRYCFTYATASGRGYACHAEEASCRRIELAPRQLIGKSECLHWADRPDPKMP